MANQGLIGAGISIAGFRGERASHWREGTPGALRETGPPYRPGRIGCPLGSSLAAPAVKEVVLQPGDKPIAPAEDTAFVGEFATLRASVSKSAGIEFELG